MNFISTKIKNENRVLIKYFLLIFIISAFLINWENLSWIFNYQTVSGTILQFFEKNISIGALEPSSETKNQTESYQSQIKEKEIKKFFKEFEKTEKENILEVPKIELITPLIFPQDNDQKKISMLLNQGAVHFPGSVLPGKEGQTIILGHSAPLGWPKIKYDWIFTRLNELEKNDEIFIYFEQKKYKYLVKEKIFLNRGESLPEVLTSSKNMLILISCWPPGQDYKRIAVVAE